MDTTREDDVRGELDALGASLAALEALRERGGDDLLRPAPGVSGWNAAQHLLHIALATDLALRNVEALIADTSPRLVDPAPHGELVQALFARGSFPRGETEAPRMVRPLDVVDPELLAAELSGVLAVRERLAERPDDVAGAPRALAHQALGPLDALDWLHFARIHAAHHLELAGEVLAKASG
jgi:hypothetical protein